MAAPQAFECTVPNRWRSAWLALATGPFAAFFLAIPWHDGLSGRLPWAMLGFVSLLGLFLGAFTLVFVLAALNPGWFLMGVVLREDGFEWRMPLRRPRRIAFDSIRRLQAINAEGDDAIRVAVYSPEG